MAPSLILILTLLFYPSHAWAYVDPGFGGYLINSITSAIVTGVAFVSATVIYFFRTILGQKIFWLWKNYRNLCVIVILGVLVLLCIFLGEFLFHTFYKPPIKHYLPGAHVIDSKRMFKGYSFYEGKLIDEQGQIVKQWSRTHHGTIDKNGDYYAQHYYDAPTWGRYTWDDKVIWEKNFVIHHELYLSPQGTVFTFTKEMHIYNNFKVDFDIILEFDKDGRELQRFSFWEHLKEFQKYHPKLLIDIQPNMFIFPEYTAYVSPWGGSYDYYHLNSITMLPANPLEKKDPAFRQGNWLISMKNGSMVFILDKDTKKVVWSAIGDQVDIKLDYQHAASMLPNGNILLFNDGFNSKRSRVLIIDPLTHKVVWEYSDKDFYSYTQGFVQPLPNGNVLVTESMKGHVFELTPDKKIVWDFYYPFDKNVTARPNNHKKNFRDQYYEIYRMTRYPKEMIDHILKEHQPT